jgi:hypothetical protein
MSTDLELKHGYIKNDFDVREWLRRNSWNRRPKNCLRNAGKK